MKTPRKKKHFIIEIFEPKKLTIIGKGKKIIKKLDKIGNIIL